MRHVPGVRLWRMSLRKRSIDGGGLKLLMKASRSVDRVPRHGRLTCGVVVEAITDEES